MRLAFIILCACVVSASAQFFTPNQLDFLDDRYGGTNSAAGDNATITNNSGGLLSVVLTNVAERLDDDTTITNSGSQLSVAGYSSNVFGRLSYRQRTRDSLWDYLPGHINDATLGEMTNGGPLALTLGDMLD